MTKWSVWNNVPKSKKSLTPIAHANSTALVINLITGVNQFNAIIISDDCPCPYFDCDLIDSDEEVCEEPESNPDAILVSRAHSIFVFY